MALGGACVIVGVARPVDIMHTTPPASVRAPKTSVDILRERDALAAELREAEALVSAIREDAEHALRHPEIAFLTLCRIAARLRRTAPSPRARSGSEPESA